MLGAPPQNPKTIFWHCAFQHPDARYTKTHFLVHGVQCYGLLERHPRTYTILFSMVHFKNPHPRYPQNLFWPTVCRGRGVWGATPQPTQFFGIVRFKYSHRRYPHLYWSMVCRCMGGWRATRQPTQFFWHHAFQTPTS